MAERFGRGKRPGIENTLQLGQYQEARIPPGVQGIRVLERGFERGRLGEVVRIETAVLRLDQKKKTRRWSSASSRLQPHRADLIHRLTEWVILTLKQEWPRRVPVIRGRDHLSQLRRDFATYYNEYRGYATLGGTVPAMICCGQKWAKPEKSAKKLLPNVARRFFAFVCVVRCHSNGHGLALRAETSVSSPLDTHTMASANGPLRGCSLRHVTHILAACSFLDRLRGENRRWGLTCRRSSASNPQQNNWNPLVSSSTPRRASWLCWDQGCPAKQ